MSFEVSTAYSLARVMVRAAIARDVIHYGLTEEDFEDFLQEAVAEMWRAYRRTGRADRPYLAGAARFAIRRYALRLRFGRSSPRPSRVASLTEAEDILPVQPPPEFRPGLSADVLSAVRARLLAIRQKRGQRGAQAADILCRILLLVSRGYSNVAIAQELGLPLNTVKVYRARLRAALRGWAAEVTQAAS
jgi:DNA-directed RNA polymerase specialized sigma24 family protein